MDFLSDELLFMGGIGIMGLSLFLALIYSIVSHRGKKRLKEKLDAEYGEKGRGK